MIFLEDENWVLLVTCNFPGEKSFYKMHCTDPCFFDLIVLRGLPIQRQQTIISTESAEGTQNRASRPALN